MNDLTEWKITDLHRQGANKNRWYFGVTKPDGKTLYAQNRSGGHNVIFSAKAPGPVKVFAIGQGGGQGTSTFRVDAYSEAGAIRKIMRYVDNLATDWNTRKMIREAGTKQITFTKRRPEIIPADRQLEAAPPKKEEPKPEPEQPNDLVSNIDREHLKRRLAELRRNYGGY